MTDAFAWRVEAACLAAWPTSEQAVIDGWIVRAAGGATRRLNSVNPTQDGPRDPASVLMAAGARLAAVGKPLRVRVPTIATGLDKAVDRLGFEPSEGETLTLVADQVRGEIDDDVRVSRHADDAWIDARATLARLTDDERGQLARTAAIVPAPAGFATLIRKGEPLAVGCGVIVEGLLVLEAIATDSAHRRQGHGRTLVSALLGWAAGAGATRACLQVQADNTPALALYRSLGFTRELYRYWYRSASRHVVGGDGLEPPTLSV